MKIAIDISPLQSGHKNRGVGFYTKNLVEVLGDKVEAVDFKKTDLSKYDIVHYPYFNPFVLSFPLFKKNKTVITIHDLIPLIYPNHYPPGFWGKIKFWLQKLALKNVEAIITDTETSKKDIVRFLGISAEKVFPIHLAPAKHFRVVNSKQKAIMKKKYALPDRFVLYVGDVNFNKNIPNLVRASKISRFPLVIVGKQAAEIENQDLSHPELFHLKKILLELKSEHVIRLGFVSDEDLVVIYNLAAVYCQPSFYEGFGLPVLEAFACGTPVVAAKTQALVEIGEPACLFANPTKPKDLAEKLKLVIENKNLRNQLVETGKILVKNYSWEKTARETLRVYDEKV